MPKSVRAEVAEAVGEASGPLVAAALRVAELLDDPEVSARDASGLSRELRQLLGELEDVTDEKVDALDELASRRRDRGSGAAAARRPAGS